MHLTELKNTPVSDLVKLGEEQMGLENLARLRKQDIVFAILKQHAKSGEDILAAACWRFYPMVSVSYAPQTVPTLLVLMTSTSLQVKFVVSIFKLVIKSKVKSVHQKEGERYFALLKVDQVNDDKPEVSRSKILFENLTPLHANSRLRMERGNGSTEDLTAVFWI